jgi:hypothetical protein
MPLRGQSNMALACGWREKKAENGILDYEIEIKGQS